jgi:phosphatidate cytidylyltransferase
MLTMPFHLKITRSDMTFNVKTFRTRALTAVVFAAVMLVGLLWNEWSFLVLFSIIHFGCWWEFLKLIEKIYKTSFHIYIKLGMMVAGYGLMLWFAGPVFHVNDYSIKDNLALPVSAAGFTIMMVGIFQKQSVAVKPFFAALLGWLYISLSWGLMLDLYTINVSVTGPDMNHVILHAIGIFPPVIVFTIWVNDTMAYIVGSFIGKTPLSSISPKKTWEGTLGGIILACVVISLFIFFVFNFSKLLSWYQWVIISAIAAISGTFGDLLESKLKRMAGVKDSGAIMPGHGGFMDRFDSLLLAIPFAWLYLRLFI